MYALLFIAYLLIGVFICGIAPNTAGENEPILILIWPLFLFCMLLFGMLNLFFIAGERIRKAFERRNNGKENA